MRLNGTTRLSTIAELLGDAKVTTWEDLEIRELVDDSRRVKEHSLFIAAEEPSDEGWRHVADAQRRGAMAIMLEPAALERYPALAAASIVVPNARAAMARLALWACDDPSRTMPIIGVTGTNGKTTTTHMLSAIFSAAKHTVGQIGTLGATYPRHNEYLGYTTPPPFVLQPLLQKMRILGVDIVTMEVSSHALALERVAGMRFAMGVFTNLSRDHLDFHKTIEEYIDAKRQLFRQAEHRVFNLDDEVGRAFQAEFGGVGYSFDASIAREYEERGISVTVPHDVHITPQTCKFYVGEMPFFLTLPGRFNIANALAAIATARQFRIPDHIIAQALVSMTGVPGRMERFTSTDCTVVVDYAHTPDALTRVLEALRESNPTRLTVVFGCGGGRDAGKRPQMGAVAEALADRCILTSDNPRHEDPARIIAEIRAGMQKTPEIEVNRGTAIAGAIAQAVPGEIILIAGKGAETEQWLGAERHPFDDRVHAQEALSLRS